LAGQNDLEAVQAGFGFFGRVSVLSQFGDHLTLSPNPSPRRLSDYLGKWKRVAVKGKGKCRVKETTQRLCKSAPESIAGG
jgi:hypothetical protein